MLEYVARAAIRVKVGLFGYVGLPVPQLNEHAGGMISKTHRECYGNYLRDVRSHEISGK